MSKGRIEHEGKNIPISCTLKDMQPHREKNCGTQFAAGELVADKDVPREHNQREPILVTASSTL